MAAQPNHKNAEQYIETKGEEWERMNDCQCAYTCTLVYVAQNILMFWETVALPPMMWFFQEFNKHETCTSNQRSTGCHRKPTHTIASAWQKKKKSKKMILSKNEPLALCQTLFTILQRAFLKLAHMKQVWRILSKNGIILVPYVSVMKKAFQCNSWIEKYSPGSQVLAHAFLMKPPLHH